MSNPYAGLGPGHFWKTAVAQAGLADAGPVRARSAKRFRMDPTDRLATAGSCFAQNVARHLRANGTVRFVETEPLSPGDPVFSGRYGNIYTARQLLQLFDECMGGTPDPACAIRRHDGRFVDIHRPFIEEAGFATAEEVVAARSAHLSAIRGVFTGCEVFVFTLGLTEAWEDPGNGRVFPVCPGIYSDDPAHPYRFVNHGFAEILTDMQAFAGRLTTINPGVRILLTVSPVPLTATYTDDHVLTATILSKSILRAVAGELAAQNPEIYYFPSYEMIAEPFTPGSAYAENMRTVRPEIIAEVMAAFEADYTGVGPEATDTAASWPTRPATPPSGSTPDEDAICDDLCIERSIGF